MFDSNNFILQETRGFPDDPVVKALASSAVVWRSAPGWGNKIPHAVWHGQKLKKKMKNTKGNEYLSFVRNGRLKL